MKHVALLGDRDERLVTHQKLDAAMTRLPPGVRAHWVATDSSDVSRVPEADGLWPALRWLTLPGFHWCRFGLPQSYVNSLVASGLIIAAHADDAGVEAVEIASHPFYVATLFQPQVGSLAGKPLSPVIHGFVAAL